MKTSFQLESKFFKTFMFYEKQLTNWQYINCLFLLGYIINVVKSEYKQTLCSVVVQRESQCETWLIMLKLLSCFTFDSV